MADTKFASEVITEPLLQKIEALIDECLAVGVDADWILNVVETKIYGDDQNA